MFGIVGIVIIFVMVFGGYTLAECPRADLKAPPKPFRMGA